MKTLPAAIIAGMFGDSNSIVLVRIIPESGDTWAELCWATKDITVLDWESTGASKSFAGNMLAQNKLGTIRQSVDIEQGGNVAKVSGLTLRILNPEYNGTDRFDQSFTGDLENRRVEIRRVFWTGSSPAWSDTLLLYEGVVEDVDYDYGIYKIKVRDAGFKRHKDIPDLILSTDDYSELSEYSKGKVAPLIYGDACDDYPDFYFPNARIYPMIRINKNKEEYLIARNKCDLMPSNPFLYFDSINRIAQLYVDSGSWAITYGRPTTIEFPLGIDIKAIFGSQPDQQGSQTDPSTLEYANAVDNDNDSYFTLGASQKLFLKIPTPSEFAAIIDEATNVIFKVRFATITGTGTIKYYNPEWDDGTGGFSTGGQAIGVAQSGETVSYVFGADKTAHGKADDQSDINDPWTFNEIAGYEFGIEMDAASSAQIENMFLYINGLLVKSMKGFLKPPRPRRRRTGLPRDAPLDYLGSIDNKALGVQGTEFGSWIDEDGRDNGFGAGELVRRGAYLIETILRDELGLISSQIDYVSFDAAGNTTDGDRKDWHTATIIEEQRDSLKIIADFCRQTGIIYFQDYRNLEKVVALKKQTALKTIDRTSIREDSIKVSLTDLDTVYNEFYVNYDRRWLTGTYQGTRHITASATNMSSNTRGGTPNTYTGLCSNSQSKYGQTKRLTLDCDWISSVTTIDRFLKWLAEWLCYRKYIVEFKSSGLDQIGLELGDQIKIDHTLLPTGVSDDASFVVFEIKDDLDNDRMKFECMQIPDLLP